MRGVKGTHRKLGDPCADCDTALTEENQVKRSGRPGLNSYCRPCASKRSSRAQRRDPSAHRERSRRYKAKLRSDLLAAYGGKCACCGESTPEFLALDHIGGGGTKERRGLKVSTSSGMYRHVRNLGYPKDRYRLLCHNCNCAIGWYGSCPHARL